MLHFIKCSEAHERSFTFHARCFVVTIFTIAIVFVVVIVDDVVVVVVDTDDSTFVYSVGAHGNMRSWGNICSMETSPLRTAYEAVTMIEVCVLFI